MTTTTRGSESNAPWALKISQIWNNAVNASVVVLGEGLIRSLVVVNRKVQYCTEL